MRICFEYESPEFMFYLEMGIDISFMLDIIMNYNTGVTISGKIYMDRLNISRDYFKTWFMIDLLSSTPYTWILAWS